jgi:hypothetical protein
VRQLHDLHDLDDDDLDDDDLRDLGDLDDLDDLRDLRDLRDLDGLRDDNVACPARGHDPRRLPADLVHGGEPRRVVDARDRSMLDRFWDLWRNRSHDRWWFQLRRHSEPAGERE